MYNEPDDRIRFTQNEAIQYKVRSAQAILQYGVGAMVDFPDQTLMTAAPEYWLHAYSAPDSEAGQKSIIKIYDERLQRVLSVRYFGMPSGISKEGIAYVRFPEWYFCPKCRRFRPLKDWQNDFMKAGMGSRHDGHWMHVPKCSACRLTLVAARIITVCVHGHIDDFPWVTWVHQRAGKPICEHPQLSFNTGTANTAGPESIRITCTACKASATLGGAFDPLVLDHMGIACRGRHPWKHGTEPCAAPPRAMQRGSSSIYFPKTVSSLVIPPYADHLRQMIEKSDAFSGYKNIIDDKREDGLTDEMLHETIRMKLESWAQRVADEIAKPVEEVTPYLEKKLLYYIDQTDDHAQTSGVAYRGEEFDALSGRVRVRGRGTDDFVREEPPAAAYDIPSLLRVALIHKVREVRALTGFTRIHPPGIADTGEEGDETFVSVKRPQTMWYPAYEVRGEGIFLEFDVDLLDRWATAQPEIRRRCLRLQENYDRTQTGATIPRTLSPQFLFLHTLAHILIRRLSFECGYTVASLRERIYSAGEEDGKAMAGILIYTASGDAEGTLGGLVQQGRPDTLPHIFKKALVDCIVCSNDPVCSAADHEQGRDSLNLSACHACILLPETSCEEFNVFLDRAMLVGTFENDSIGFYSTWVKDILAAVQES